MIKPRMDFPSEDVEFLVGARGITLASVTRTVDELRGTMSELKNSVDSLTSRVEMLNGSLARFGLFFKILASFVCALVGVLSVLAFLVWRILTVIV